VAKKAPDPIAPLRKRLAAIDKLLAKYPDPWAPGSPWASTGTTMSAIRAALAVHPPRTLPKPGFLARADEFLRAMLIANRMDDTDYPLAEIGRRASAKFAVESIRIGHVRTERGLADLETDLLTEWWERTGPVVQRFWREVRRAGLRYRPRDLLAEIHERGRIRTREQYEFAIDTIGTLTSDAAAELSRLIGAYEARASRR